MQEDPKNTPKEEPVAASTPPKTPQHPENKLNAKAVAGNVKEYIRDLLNLKDDTDYTGSVEEIRLGIDFRGYNVWILIASIFIASIGLNMNSTAVIIGAMLISPLMGPILGAGLAVASNDLPMLIRSLKSFGIAVGVSLLTSYVYFKLTPISNDTSELLSRVKPTMFDVAIASFGGLAGILAATRKIKTNVIPGVAIATALMPPLCTAGYGLASGNYHYFVGALYLFLLNSVFIWMATMISLRYLDFPMKEYVNSRRRKRVKYALWIFSLLIIIPSIFKLVEVVKVNRYEEKANNFVSMICNYENTRFFAPHIDFYSEPKVIELVCQGKTVPQETMSSWRASLTKFGLVGTELVIIQNDPERSEEMSKDAGISGTAFNNINDQNASLIATNKILSAELRRYQSNNIDFPKMSQHLSNMFSDLASIRCGLVSTPADADDIDTTFTVLLSWKPEIDSSTIEVLEGRLTRFFEIDYAKYPVQILRLPSPTAGILEEKTDSISAPN